MRSTTRKKKKKKKVVEAAAELDGEYQSRMNHVNKRSIKLGQRRGEK